MKMGDSNTNNNNTQSIADYLAQLLKDKKQLAAFPNVFLHVERLLDDEIGRVRGNLFQINGKKAEPLVLPDAAGPQLSLSEKVYVPVKDHPDFNFVGRILGPRGMTTKQLEQETGCKIMVRGKGSMRDKKKEELNRGKPNWEHLNDELHVLITVEDTENRANMKMQRAIDEVKKLLIVSEGEDELKKRQLMELAIINGTYRDSQTKTSSPLEFVAGLDANTQRLIAANNHAALQNIVNQQNALRWLGKQSYPERSDSPGRLFQQQQWLVSNHESAGAPLGGAPLILSPRLQVPTSLANSAGLMNGSGGPPPLINPNDTQGLLYAQYAAAASEYANYTGLVSPLLAAEYSTDPTGNSVAGGKDRRHQISLNGQTIRQHPYPRS